jgi:hypothetical protein
MALFAATRASCDRGPPQARTGRGVAAKNAPQRPTIRWRLWVTASEIYMAIRATMLAKISRARRDFPIVGPVALRAANGAD